MLRSKKPPSSAPSFGANRLRKRGRKPPPHPGQESPGAIVITPRRSTHHRPSRRRGRHRRSYGLLEPYREDCGSGIEEKKEVAHDYAHFFSRISGNRARRLARDNWRANATSRSSASPDTAARRSTWSAPVCLMGWSSASPCRN